MLKLFHYESKNPEAFCKDDCQFYPECEGHPKYNKRWGECVVVKKEKRQWYV